MHYFVSKKYCGNIFRQNNNMNEFEMNETTTLNGPRNRFNIDLHYEETP